MRAVGLMTHGGPEVLEVVDVPEVHAGPGQVRLRIYAAAVNPTDTMARNGSRAAEQKADPPPYIPGMDAAGIVDEVGEGVTTGVAVGDRVMAMVCLKEAGAYREQIVLDQRAVVSAPAGSHVRLYPAHERIDSAAITRPAWTFEGQVVAVQGLRVHGGYVIQLAKADGLMVIADASPADRDLIKTLGADIIVGRGDDVAERFGHSRRVDGVRMARY